MALAHKVGDVVRIIKADAFPKLVGAEVTIAFAGPWKAGDKHPNDALCIADNDYLVVPPSGEGFIWFPKFPGDSYLALREANVEAV